MKKEGYFTVDEWKSLLENSQNAAGYSIENCIPLNESECGMYLEQLSNPDSMEYNLNIFFRIHGSDRDTVDVAMRDTMAAHETFRSRYGSIDGVPVRIFTDELPVISWCSARDAESAEQSALDSDKPFDLGASVPVRMTGFELERDGILIHFNAHHIVLDGGSADALNKELFARLKGESPSITETDISDLVFKDRTAIWKKGLDYFRSVFEDGIPVNEMPVRNVRPAVIPVSDKQRSLDFDKSRLVSLESAARAAGCTTFQFLFSAVSIVLGKYCASEDLVLGFPVNTRDEEARSVLGMFVNLAAVRVKPVADKLLSDYLRDTADLIKASAHTYQLPFFRFVNEFDQIHDKSRHPVFDVVINYLYMPEVMSEGDLSVELTEIPQRLKRDMSVTIRRRVDEMDFVLQYSSLLYDDALIERFLEHLSETIDAMCTCPDLTVGEAGALPKRQMTELEELSMTAGADIPDVLFHRMFEKAVRLNPEGRALVACDKTLSFSELNLQANRIAHALIDKGIKKGDCVVLLLPRRSFYFSALFGVLKAGAAFIPCDPEYPPERISHITGDSNAALIITTKEHMAEHEGRNPVEITSLLDHDDSSDPSVSMEGDDLAYMIYTSGSTGVPKGVMLTHRGVCNYCMDHPANIFYDALAKGIDTVLSVTTVSFDLSLKDTLGVLVNGKTVVFASEEQMNDPRILTELIRENSVEVMSATPSRIMQYLGYAPFEEEIRGMKLVIAGGEAYPKALLTRIKNLDVPMIINTYGPTEITISSNMARLENTESVSVGRPILNVSEYIVNAANEPVPRGVTGELLIGGPGVAKGYRNLDEQTAERFIVFRGSRFYRSGDIAKWDEDGNVLILGRMDGQVKLRGLRIELGEVESVLMQQPGIKRAVAAVKTINDQQQLCAYYVSDEPLDEAQLRQNLSERLTRYMIPAAFVRLETILVTANGKTDLKALPVPESVSTVTDMTPPQTEDEKKLFDTVADIAGLREFGVHTAFEDIGLTSLTMVALMLRVSEVFEKDITMAVLRKNNTVEKLAAALLDTKEDEAYGILTEYPLTQTQYGIYVECLTHPDTTMYNIPVLWRLDDSIDIDRLQRAVFTAIDAHPYMKARLVDRDGQIFAIRDDERAANVEVIQTDMPLDPSSLVKPYDLLKDELYRARIYRTKEGNAFYLDMHHIASDGRSRALLQKDIEAAYMGGEIKKERFTGFDAALKEGELRSGPGYEEAKKWYEKLLSGVQITEPLPDSESETSGDNLRVATGLDETEIRDFCAKNRLTGNAFFNAVFGYVLGIFTASQDTVFTTIYDGRSDSRLHDTVCMLVKTLPVRCQWTEETGVVDYLDSVRDQLNSSMDNDVFSFAEIAHASGVNADLMVVWQDEMAIAPEFCGAPARIERPALETAKSSLSVDVTVCDGKIAFEIEYRPEVYSEGMIRSFADCMSQVASEFMSKEILGQVRPVSGKTEENLKKIHDTDWPVAERPAYRLLQDSAEKWPERIAVVSNGVSLTYKELNDRANRLGHKLRTQGLDVEKICAVLLERGVEVYAARQGVLKAGGAFLPIDPEYPDDRISFILEDAGCDLIITSREIKDKRPALFEKQGLSVCFVEEASDTSLPSENLNIPVPFDALAYSIYTSGSTGRPKGVLLTQRNLVSFVDDNPKNREILGFIKHGKVSLALASVAFDVSVMEEFIPLAHGLTVIMATENELHDYRAMLKLCLENNVDIMTCTPSLLSNYLDVSEMRPMIEGLKIIDVGAEAFPAALYDKIRAINKNVYIMNGYGPTETTISCTMAVMEGQSRVTIGIPNSNVKVVMIDARGHVLPVGALGEMVILGEGVGRGYKNRDDLTAKNFIRLWDRPAYRSGDLARILPDGNIEFRGRTDNQVKLRGLRVELDEIENVMLAMPGVLLAKVIVRNNGTEDYLAGFFTENAGVTDVALRDFMRSRLTPYMIPDVLMRLDEMPLTSNGKIDKNKLPEVSFERSSDAYVAPESEEEKAFCDCFAQVLKLERVGVTDSFFEIGGTSLSAMRVVSFAVEKGWNLVYRNVFDHTTPRELAAFVTGQAKEEAVQNIPEDPVSEEIVSQVKAGEVTTESEETVNSPDQAVCDALEHNSISDLEGIESGSLGNVLLTGATGFLGIHVLRELTLSKRADSIICLVRPKKRQTALRRLKTLMEYYFSDTFDSAFDDRIKIVHADITDEDLGQKLEGCEFDTIFNCAAVVKHFAIDDSIERVNLYGVRNLIDLAVKRKVRFIQVSTESVAGQSVNGSVPEDRYFTEHDLDIGQTLGTKYTKSKFMAEKEILTAVVQRGLSAKIMRVGNLMSRRSDGEFQINFVTNGFMSRLKAYVVLGCFPVEDLDMPVEFSPIDSVAESLVLLSGTQDKYTVFHADNCHVVHMANILEAMEHCGMKLDIVSGSEFAEALKTMQTDPRYSLEVSSLLSYRTNDDEAYRYVNVSNAFTVKALYRLGFSWPVITPGYIERAIMAMYGLGFFELR